MPSEYRKGIHYWFGRRKDDAALGEGGNPDKLDESGFGALHRASAGGHVAVVRRLLEAKASAELRDVNGSTALHHAATVGNDGVVGELLAVASRKAVDAVTTDGTTALMASALHGHTAVAERLLQQKADVCVVDEIGGTALMRACSKGHKMLRLGVA